MDSMDVNEITKVIDGVYKNITDNFNPASKQMIATGKAYLKSLHGASAACSMYLDALTKLSKQAQQSSVGTSLDIGSSMMQIADVFKEIHTQQLTTLKAFYVDFLVPLETNLEKDVKVIQNEQKKFLVSHKHRVESYNKAVSNAKKVRKKSKKSSHPSSNTLDKEIRIMQNMEEERSKLEAFCEEALREALTQERRRYGFILERQASLAKHYLAFYNKGSQSLGQKLDHWMKVAKSREALPENMQTNLIKKIQQQGEEECIYCSPRRPADDTASISSQLRKTKSMEAGEMLNIQNSNSSNCSSGGVCGGIGNYQLTAASSRGGPVGHLQNVHSHHHPQDLPITSAGALSRAKSDTSLGVMNGCNGGGIYGTTGLALINDHHPQQQQQQQQQGPPLPPSDNFRSKSMALSPTGPALSSGGNSGSTSSNQEPGHVGYAKALYAYLSNGDNQLCFLEGDMIALIGERNRGWQFGENLRTQKMGWFPVAYTESLEPPHSKSTADLMMIAKHTAGASPVPPPMPPPLPINNNGGAMPRTPENKAMQKPGAKNLMIPSNRTNDSLHSSNDSGFSNDVGQHQAHHAVHHGQVVVPPPQPEIDYSDEEPQFPNSEEIKAGNKWLMDRYHMSESARITSTTRRRSLSSGNLSTSDREQPDSLHSTMIIRNNNLRNSAAFAHNGAGNSPRGPHHQLATANTFYDENKEGGALKKFLSRTKSLIWRRPSNAADHAQYNGQNGNDSIRIQRPHQALESISCADTVSELWGSHSSIVEMTEFEMKELSPSSTIKREMMTMTDDNDQRKNGASQENEYYANGNIVKSNIRKGRGGEQKMANGNSESSNVPTLPPRNDKTRSSHQTTSISSKMQLSPGSSSTNSNLSIPKEADNSCLVVSDHTRSVKQDYGENYQNSRNTRPPKENGSDQQQDRENRGKRYREVREEKQRKVRDENSSGSNSSKQVARVESFAVSEAPIIPENSAKFSRRGVANGSVALSSRTTRSRGTTITNDNQSEAMVETRGRRKIWQDHAANDDEYNSEEKDIDEEEDEGTIDFNDNDEYDEEEAASSVFMEADNEQDVSNNKTTSMSRSSGGKLMQSNKEPKNLQCSATSSGGTKRSKSSDVTTRTDNSRRSRSSSARTYGMDTVDMPKRHGGFPREKVSRSAAVQNGLESVASRSTSKSRHQESGMRSSSSPAQRPRDQKDGHKGKSSGQSKKSAVNGGGPMYKGRPIGSPPPIPAPLPQKSPPQQPTQPPPPPPPPQSSSPPVKTFADASTEVNGDLTEAEPDYGTIKGSPSPSRKEDDLPPMEPLPPKQQKHQLITMKQTIVPYSKHQSLIIRDAEGRKAAPRSGAAWKGSFRSEIHTVELITTADVEGGASSTTSSVNGQKPVYDYGSFIRRRLYYPERGSRLDQKSERSGNYCGPWYDLWGEDPSVSVG